MTSETPWEIVLLIIGIGSSAIVVMHFTTVCFGYHSLFYDLFSVGSR